MKFTVKYFAYSIHSRRWKYVVATLLRRVSAPDELSTKCSSIVLDEQEKLQYSVTKWSSFMYVEIESSGCCKWA